MINIIEDVVAKEYQIYLNSLLNGELSLYYNLTTCVKGDDVKPDDNVKDVPQYTHTFIRDGNITSDCWKIFEPIKYNFMAKTGLGLNKKLIQVKLNFNPQDTSFLDNQYFMPHIDRIDKGITGIYYMNNSDGDTLFFDNDGNITERFTPKQGTMVFFDNTIFHAGQPPRKNLYRSIVNFNWI
jgi:antitoxin component YwqK of YwqJK toxin-antitoxin module